MPSRRFWPMLKFEKKKLHEKNEGTIEFKDWLLWMVSHLLNDFSFSFNSHLINLGHHWPLSVKKWLHIRKSGYFYWIGPNVHSGFSNILWKNTNKYFGQLNRLFNTWLGIPRRLVMTYLEYQMTRRNSWIK